MKHKERPQQAGMSQLELLITVAVMGVASAIAIPVAKNLNTESQRVSLESSLATLNSAVKLYLASGGNIPANADVNAVIAKLKTVRKKVEGDTSVIAFEGSFIDPRVTLTQDRKQKIGINWNHAEGRFVQDESDDRFHLIRSKEASEVVEEERFGSALAWGEKWIWDYTEAEDKVIVDPTLVSLVPETEIEEFEFSGPSITITPAQMTNSVLSVGANEAVNASFEGPNGRDDRHQTWNGGGKKAYTTEQENVEGWNTTASDGLIEVWETGFQNVDSYDGNYHVEFNANQVSTLWQEVDVQGKDAVNISFAHGQRVKNTEQLRLLVGTTPPATKTSSGQTENLESQGFSEIMETNSDAVKSWQLYSDVYEVPEGASTLYFAFQSIGEFSGNSYGNFLDEVSFVGVTRVKLDGLGFDIDAGNSISNVIQSGRIRLEDARFEDNIEITGDLPEGFTVEKLYTGNGIELTITGQAFRYEYEEIFASVAFTTTSTDTSTRSLYYSVNDGYAVSDEEQYLVEFE